MSFWNYLNVVRGKVSPWPLEMGIQSSGERPEVVLCLLKHLSDSLSASDNTRPQG